MNMGDISTFISTNGFPIFMCLLLFWYQVQSNKSHKEEMDKMSQAIENNTVALTVLTERIGNGRDSDINAK